MSAQRTLHGTTDAAGRPLAIAAAALFLVNLMLLPGIAFVVLCVLWSHKRARAAPLARAHLGQALCASLVGGTLLAATLAIGLLNGWHSPWTWVAMVLYFTLVHSTLILLGMVAFVHAINGRIWRYPWLPCG